MFLGSLFACVWLEEMVSVQCLPCLQYTMHYILTSIAHVVIWPITHDCDHADVFFSNQNLRNIEDAIM